jgi:hypothetical protein
MKYYVSLKNNYDDNHMKRDLPIADAQGSFHISPPGVWPGLVMKQDGYLKVVEGVT